MDGKWLHEMDDEGRTPLDRAFSSGHRAIAEMMLAQDKEDRSAHEKAAAHPMHRAAYLGLAGAVQTLLSAGASPAELDELSETPLHKAAREGHVEAVRALAAVCDVNAVSGMGMTALHWATLAGNREVVEVLLEFGADPTIRSSAADGLTAKEMASTMDYDALVDEIEHKSCYT